MGYDPYVTCARNRTQRCAKLRRAREYVRRPCRCRRLDQLELAKEYGCRSSRDTRGCWVPDGTRPEKTPVFAQGLVRRFGDIEAVAGIDLSISAGEIFGFLGPNGAGKSTTVRMLTTLLRPTAGTARVAGHDVVKQADAVRRSIGVALQDAAIDPLMTGRELLSLQSILHGIPKDEGRRRGAALLETVGLSAAGDRRVGT